MRVAEVARLCVPDVGFRRERYYRHTEHELCNDDDAHIFDERDHHTAFCGNEPTLAREK